MEEKQSKGLAIASLVLSIIAILGCYIPFLNIFSILMAVIGLILGIVAIVKKQGGMGIAGTIISIISLIIAWCINLGFIALIGTAGQALDENSKVEGLEIANYTLGTDGEDTVVTGQVTNNTGKAIIGAMVFFQGDGTDDDGANQTCIDATETLASGATWDFKAICSGHPTQITDSHVTFVSTDQTSADNPASVEVTGASDTTPASEPIAPTTSDVTTDASGVAPAVDTTAPDAAPADVSAPVAAPAAQN